MAIFRRRRARAGEPPEAARPEPAAPRLPTHAEQLRGRLREIVDGNAPEDALEPALRAVLAACGAQAGAICLYDPRHAILRLAVEVGLSDEGCRRLRNVRRGDPSTWDMPLHGLLNRRAYLIESASKNRYVPRLVEPAGSVRTVACVPLYAGPSPVGSLVVISLAPRTLGERDIRLLERPVVELAGIIEAVRQRAAQVEEPVAAPPLWHVSLPEPEAPPVPSERERLRGEVAARVAESARLSAEIAARSGELERLRAGLAAAAEERARLGAELERARREAGRVEALSEALATAEQERVRLAAELETAANARAGQARVEVSIERTRAEAARTVEVAAAELARVRATAAAEQANAAARVAQLTAEVERLHARLAAAERAAERERELVRSREREHSQLASDLRAATAREQQLREELAAAPGPDAEAWPGVDAVRAAEEAKAAAVAEAEAVRTALDSSQAIVEALEEEARQAHVEIDRLAAAEHAAQAEHARLEVELAEVRTRHEPAAARLETLAGEMDTLRAERDQLAAAMHEQQAEAAALAARLETLSAERDRLRDGLAGVGAERERFAAEAAETAAARERLEQGLARETRERARLTEALAGAQAALGALEAAQAEAAARSAEVERLVAERDRAVAERDALLGRLGTGTTPGAPAGAREPVRVVTVAPPQAGRARPRGLEPGRQLVAVLDTDATWEAVQIDGHQVGVLEPGDDVGTRLASGAPARIVVNLAAPGALSALAALRAAGVSARLWGCLADPTTDRALPLGMIEPAGRPLDPEAVLALLGTYATRGTRLVTAGTDVDALMSLRQALARRGISVSMAWDAKQAIDLLGVVRPGVVVVDLALPRRDGYGILAHLGKVDPLPSAIIIPGSDDATGFAAALADPAHASRAVGLGRFLREVLGRSEAAPVDRRPKIRAVGRK